MKLAITLILLTYSLSSLAENLWQPDSQTALDNFASMFIKQGADSTLKGKNANPFSLKNVVTASKVIADYKANQLKANKVYEDKFSRIQTVASRIDAGMLNTPFIVANGKNQFEDILIYINPNDDRFLDIQAGDKIDLICKGKGYQIMSPAFGDCLFTKDYVNKASPIILANLKKASNSNYEPSSLEEFKTILIYLSLEPQIKNDCEISEQQCLISLNAARKGKEAVSDRAMNIFKKLNNKSFSYKTILYQF